METFILVVFIRTPERIDIQESRTTYTWAQCQERQARWWEIMLKINDDSHQPAVAACVPRSTT